MANTQNKERELIVSKTGFMHEKLFRNIYDQIHSQELYNADGTLNNDAYYKAYGKINWKHLNKVIDGGARDAFVDRLGVEEIKDPKKRLIGLDILYRRAQAEKPLYQEGTTNPIEITKDNFAEMKELSLTRAKIEDEWDEFDHSFMPTMEEIEAMPDSEEKNELLRLERKYQRLTKHVQLCEHEFDRIWKKLNSEA